MRRLVPILKPIAAGLCMAVSIPPWGFWPLAFVGIALFDHVIDGTQGRTRFVRAWLVWLALFAPTMFWMREMTAPGYVIAVCFYAALLAGATFAAPRGVGRYLAIPGAVMLAEWVRWRWPFGGVPLSNLAVGQVGGPLAPMLRLGGALFVVGITMLAGMSLAAAWNRRFRMAGALIAVPIVALAIATVAPKGSGTGDFLDIALVQGGGPQGTRAEDTAPGFVVERHLAASEDLTGDLDLIVWPEDVVDVARLTGSPTEAALMAVAREHSATFIAGVIEDEGEEHFHNWAVAYGPDGDEVDRYEKVERVPFGEWVPMRGLLETVADGSLPARDAVIGPGPAVVDTPAGTLGVAISWEIFFGERGREAVNHGGQVLLNPTNGASFRGTLVQTQQIANSRMRAIENGRWVAQVAPTGFSAIVTPDGDVIDRTGVSERAIVYGTVELRSGRTIYTRVGDILAITLAVALIAAGWLLDRRSGASPSHQSP